MGQESYKEKKGLFQARSLSIWGMVEAGLTIPITSSSAHVTNSLAPIRKFLTDSLRFAFLGEVGTKISFSTKPA